MSTSVAQPLRVVLADDQPVVREGFAAVLAAAEGIEVVGTAGDGRALVHLVAETAPDVALVDVRMPVLDGIAATAQVADLGRTRVLVLTTFDLDEYVFSAVRAGASGFLLKDVSADRLVEAVRLVADGSMLLGPGVTRRLVEDFAALPSEPSPAAPDAPGTTGSWAPHEVAARAGLTPRETEVLGLVARGGSNAEIAASLVVGVETVKSHVAEVLRKLAVRDRVQAVVWAYEHGLVAPGDPAWRAGRA
ncbi:response regulator [Nocardioides bruguierae]|uniref:Response regulator transcription factor n=1 Tax=Nocardioides bruguierae TaxID=2945102 RepID=A0A9X2D9C2_9ACTN|nr:response regulator transcription factor [Nocardioides bruguierae]MCM0621541.1 response regulator transcription factor [Nocardioides bruguierae]